jgi:hypothetical protein
LVLELYLRHLLDIQVRNVERAVRYIGLELRGGVRTGDLKL